MGVQTQLRPIASNTRIRYNFNIFSLHQILFYSLVLDFEQYITRKATGQSCLPTNMSVVDEGSLDGVTGGTKKSHHFLNCK